MALKEIKIELTIFSSYASRDGSITLLGMYSSDFVDHCSGYWRNLKYTCSVPFTFLESFQ